MALADRTPAGSRVAVLDIERIKGRAEVGFWGLGDFKNRRIHPDNVTQWPRSILVCWSWLGETRVHAAAEWDGNGHAGMLDRVWHVLDEADAVIGHNVARFDVRGLRGEFAESGMRPPRPFKTIDTLTIARREFMFESNTLDACCARFGVARKVDHYDPDVAQRAIEGSVTDQRRLTRYCKGDVVASRELYYAMRAWHPSHPHVGAPTGELLRCNVCGGTNLTRVGSTRAVVLDYALYRCECGANVKSGHVARVASTRGAR